MTYNILDGGINRERYILEVLRMTRPDIVLFEEVTNFSVIQDFGLSLNMQSFFSKGNSKRNLAILSRFPIVSSESYHPFPLKTSILAATIEHAPNQFLQIFGVHLKAQISVVSELKRMWEADTILKKIARDKTYPCLIAGDFNAVAPNDSVVTDSLLLHSKVMLLFQGGHIFRSAIAKFIKAGFTDCYRFLHPLEDGFTLPPPNPIMRLDYIFADNSLREKLEGCDVLTDSQNYLLASDHYPLVAEFNL
jgi:endonuclease/exonuclease/phosphatase family metal-dependent hydrolase